MSRFTIIRDTREQKGWNFTETDYCEGQINKVLNTGDYTLVDMEQIICVERKGSVGELATNIVQSRFDREIVRMREYKHAYIVCEFEMRDVMMYPYNQPEKVRKYIKTTPQFLLKRINEIGLEVNIIFAGKYGKEYTTSLFKRIWEKYSSQ